MRDAGILKDARVILEDDDARRRKIEHDLDEQIQGRFSKIEEHIKDFEKSLESERAGEAQSKYNHTERGQRMEME